MTLLNGIKWLGISRLFNKATLICFYVYLGANLDKDLYGVMAILVMLASYPNWLTFGFELFLIKSESNPCKKYYNVAWTYERFLLRLGAGILLFLFSEEIAQYLNIMAYQYEVKILSLIAIFQAFENNVIPILMRKLDFKKRFFLDSTNSISIIIFFPLIVYTKNVIFIPCIFIFSSFLKLFLGYMFVKRVPSFYLNYSLFKEMFRYGRWISASNLMLNLRERFDVVALAYFFNPSVLAIYHANNLFTNKIMSELYLLLNKVLFPVQCRSSENTYEFVSKFQIFIYITFLLFIYASYYLIEFIINLFYGSEFNLEYSVLLMLLMSSVFRLLTGLHFSYFRVMNRPKYETFIIVIFLFFNLIFLSLFAYFDYITIDNFVISLFTSECITYIFTLFFKNKIERITLKQFYLIMIFQLEVISICYFM